MTIFTFKTIYLKTAGTSGIVSKTGTELGPAQPQLVLENNTVMLCAKLPKPTPLNILVFDQPLTLSILQVGLKRSG